MNNTFPAVMTIAGSDSGGGAGIQADLRTFNAFNVYGCSAITAVTAQNPDAVRKVDIMTPECVNAQINAVLEAFPVKFAKTGMLADRSIIKCASDAVRKYRLQLVVDPSGARLLEKEAVSAVKELLFPLAAWITPNIPEAELLCGWSLKTKSDFAAAARFLYEQYRCNVILKGGHASAEDRACDVVCFEGEIYLLTSPAADVSGNTSHGTGCTLSAALTANLALKKSWQESVISAKAFVYGSLMENRYLSDTLSQMYVPTENYFNKVDLKRL